VEPRVGNNREPFRFNRQFSSAFAQFRTGFEENIIELFQLGRQAVRVLLNSFFSLFLTLMISGFLLLDPSRIRNFIRSLVPPRHAHAFDDLLERLDFGLSGVVRGQALICLINGVLTGIGVALLGIPFVVTLSVLAAVFSLIPIFGVLISTIPILLMALTVSFTTVLLALGWILAIHFLEGNFLNPKILGDSSKIHPVLIVFALVVGEHFFGVMGALLAVPIFSLLQNSFLFIKHKAETQDMAL
jgi:predicted PurR-regulated permease PerM